MTFYFYDLETSGINPRESRVMQFAGQRTDMDLHPVGDPHNVLITMTDDILPEPEAILITGITPQKTRVEGMTEAEFLKIFAEEIAVPDTIFVGFNTIRFDDEFMRYMLYRNFYDAYEWQWKDGRSRWDLLDVTRMARALRPEGVKWPFGPDGRPSNRLELLTSLNGLDHTAAHDALSDVTATIAVARLLKNAQPKLFKYLLSMRDKQKIKELVYSDQPFAYCSGKYTSEHEKLAIAICLGDHPARQGVLVYDLRHDPKPFLDLTADQLAAAWSYQTDPQVLRLPVKTLQFNRCPAIAPMSVIDEPAKERLKIDIKKLQQHRAVLAGRPEFLDKLYAALAIMDKQRQLRLLDLEPITDAMLYDGFIADADKTRMSAVRAAEPDDLSGFEGTFDDQRLNNLLPLYKARNYPKKLNSEEREAWEEYRRKRLLGGGEKSRFSKYFHSLRELSTAAHISDEQRYLLEELQLWGESIMPDMA